MSVAETKIRKGVTVAIRAGTYLWRPRTEEEHRAWSESDASKGMNDAGETKLDSPTRSRRADGRTYKVVRARATSQRGWHRIGKCVELEDSEGVRWFTLRSDVAVVAV